MVSALGLHCLPMSHKKNARRIWVKRMNASRQYGRANLEVIEWQGPFSCMGFVQIISAVYKLSFSAIKHRNQMF